MKNIKNISFFDFDDTLFITPGPDLDENGEKIIRTDIVNGKSIKYLTSIEFKEATGLDYPYFGWWSRKESLDQSIFNIKLNKYVYKQYINDKRDNRYLVMMTGRLKTLKNEVISILDNNDIKFNDYYFNPGGISTLKYKIGVLNKYIEEFKDLESIRIYDDRDEHISHFIEWGESISNINIDIIHIKGEKQIN